MYPQYVEVNGKQYKINTDYRVAIECNRIAEDITIGDLERSLAIICKLFGSEAIDDGKEKTELYDEFIILAKKYLACGKELIEENISKPDMDFDEDYGLIWASMYSDYRLDIDKEKIHWWKFMELMNGLSNSEFGNCCVLNRVRNIRNLDISQIKDAKERQKMIKAKEQVSLKKITNKATKEQKESASKFYEMLGIRKE